ncbi:protein SMG7 [Prunus yedoensis var. nudiflora]|uniref:Protein SMG7 n=1 Tax=Prunus yedoensis var. nudiflora TaxID=2094558 RepID=A0A314Z6F0_PRUYE|nr:protein SMG7 [Prunus yedoensis var. nudiflora]
MEAGFGASSHLPVSIANSIPQNLQPTLSHALKLSTEEEMSLVHSLRSMGFMGNGYVLASEPVAISIPFQQPVNGSTSGTVYSPTKAPEAMLPFKVDAISSSGAIADGLTVKTSSNLPTGIRKNPMPSSTKGNGLNSSINLSSHSNPNRFTDSNGLSGPVNFPFPGKHSPPMQLQG